MDFLCFHRDRPGSDALRDELIEAHWSYMDRYATRMIARGPALSDDGGTATGSLHVLDLPGPAAARAFAFDEPNYQAGVYRDVLLRRWHNTLGRTMWEFPGGSSGGNRYLVLGLAARPAPMPPAFVAAAPVPSAVVPAAGPAAVPEGSPAARSDDSPAAVPADLAVPPGQERLIAYGPLLSDDGATWLGTAMLIQAPDPDAARAPLTAGRYAAIEVHPWQFGGRR